jgi:FlaA1/EpsC-like NDP-sugar epimerase
MAERVLVVGAGDAGIAVVKELRANPRLGLIPVGFVDDDEAKQGMHIQGMPVFRGRERIAEIVVDHQVSQVIIAMPSAPGTVIREVLEVCERVGVPARTIPSLRDILAGRARIGEIREIQIEDLLRRSPVEIDSPAVGEMLRACRVLVTGAGGALWRCALAMSWAAGGAWCLSSRHRSRVGGRSRSLTRRHGASS